MWLASLDILDFLPIETKNAENGLIVTGHGKPPGGDTEYRATILIVDAAIDASALKFSLFTKNGPIVMGYTRNIRHVRDRARTIASWAADVKTMRANLSLVVTNREARHVLNPARGSATYSIFRII